MAPHDDHASVHNSQVAAEHDRLASELLSILVSAGFLAPAGAPDCFVATASVSSPETAAQLAGLKATADQLATAVVPDLASNVRLIWVCMQALPQILKGACCMAPLLGQLAMIRSMTQNTRLLL